MVDVPSDQPNPEFDLFVANSRMAGFCAGAKWRCLRAWSLGENAKTRSKELFPRASFPGKEGDVFRHVYWHALMIIAELAEDWVTEFGEQWEIWPDNDEQAKVADLENNAFGRRVGKGIAAAGMPFPTAAKQAETLIANMVANHGQDLNFDF